MQHAFDPPCRTSARCACKFAFDGAHVEVAVWPNSEDPLASNITFWTDVEVVVLLEWQACPAGSSAWTLPPHPWPPQSGVNGPSLQTMFSAAKDRAGQELRVSLRSCDACRWQLFCLGPSMRRIPEDMQELTISSDTLSEQRPDSQQSGSAAWATCDSFDDEESDEEESTGAIVKLQLRGTPPLVTSDESPQRAVLAARTFAALTAAAAETFPGQAASLGIATDEVSAVGHTGGFSMRLDSDAAVAMFLATAAHSQLGPPTVELRVPEAGGSQASAIAEGGA